MRTSLFDYNLPPELIAQLPCEPRDHSRLLVVRRSDGTLRHLHFFDLPDLLEPGDLLVLNDTRVLPARLLGKRACTGGKWEGLFLRETADGAWELLCQTRGTLQEGEFINITSPQRERGTKQDSSLTLQALMRLPGGRWLMQPLLMGTTVEVLERYGHVPLPPYIRKGIDQEEDRNRYQTIYAQHTGAVAAPTAGLHFTERVFERLRTRGIGWTSVTLHVGLGTFQPIQVDDYTQHPMHGERGELSQTAADAINACTGRIVAVGTTAVRVLESVARLQWGQASGLPLPELGKPEACRHVMPWSGETDLFIYPPYRFKLVDALITNFHLPRTTLLLLVAAFAGVDLIQQAYQAAIAERYRFYSYGDAMLILP